jgi:hypothetical protein
MHSGSLPYWLLPAVLIGVPVLAGAVLRVAPRVLPIDDRRARLTEFRVVSVVILVGGVLEWGIGTHQAMIAPGLIADYPHEFWRWVGAVAQPALASCLFCGLGAHAVRAWWRTRGQPRS